MLHALCPLLHSIFLIRMSAAFEREQQHRAESQGQRDQRGWKENHKNYERR